MIMAYLTDAVTHNQYKGDDDEWGTPSTRSTVTRRARVDYKNRQAVGIGGDMVVSSAKVYLPLLTITRTGFDSRVAATIAYEDTLTFDGVEHPIIQIGIAKDFRGRFLEVYVR